MNLRTKKTVYFFLFPVLFLVYIFSISSCSGSNEPENSDRINYQVPGCFNKSSEIDSCFSYSFTDKLVVEFCANGNCCPDSNRFIFMQEIKSDTINLTITDIEQHLCRCICNYTLHSESSGLLLDSYLYNVFISDSIETKLLYSERVFRNL